MQKKRHPKEWRFLQLKPNVGMTMDPDGFD